MYCTMPSGTRYQIGSCSPTRSRQSVEEIASAGTSINVILSGGSWAITGECSSIPGRVQPTKCARSKSASASRQVRIWAMASAPVMK